MDQETKEYIDNRVDDIVIQRSASYFKVLEKLIAEMNKNVLTIMSVLNKLIK